MGIKTRIKRILAGLLVICIVFAGIPVTGGITVYAMPEIDNSPIADGHNDNTIWASLNNGSRFDLVGIKKSGVYSYQTDNSLVLQTVFGFGGYHTYMNDSTRNSGKINYAPNSGTYNGGVMEFASDHAKFPNMEVSVKTNTSPDGQYVFVDYYIYNKNNVSKTMYIGTTADIQIGDDDGADISRTFGTREGFYMVNGKTGTDAMATFECITNDPALRIYGDEWGVKRWIGAYSTNYNCNHLITAPDEFDSSYQNQMYDNYTFKENRAEFNTSKEIKTNAMGNPTAYLDSAFAYSWKVDVRPYEIAHRRVAYTVRPTSYYISSDRGADSASRDGSYGKPFATIDYAMAKLNGKRGYIYIMDYDPMNGSISVPAGSGTDITILSSNFDEHGETISDIVELKRGPSLNGPMFRINSNNSKLRINNITISGNNVESIYPLVKAISGELYTYAGTTFKDNKVTDPASGSALDITGSASLIINSGTVSGNISNGSGAVNFNSSGKFSMVNDIHISNNVNAAGEKANIYLAAGKYITVEGDLGVSRIGVTSEQRPEASIGETTSAGQEVVIAVPSADYPGSLSSCPFVDSFLADGDSGTGTGIFATVGSSVLNNSKNTVLKRNGYTVSFTYRDSSTGGTVTGAPDTPGVSFASGDEVVILPPGAISGFELTAVSIDQGTGSTLTAAVTPGAGFGRITGTMPVQDVAVTYEYTRMGASIAFVTNGGTPQPETMTGTAGSSVNALLPTVTRYGYVFHGWSKSNSQSSPEYISSLPAVYPDAPETYYAIWESDPTVTFDYTVDYTNQNGTIVFQTTTSENAYSVEAEIQSQKKNIHGYVWSLLDSYTSPVEYNYDGPGAVPIGSFNGSSGLFVGRMPGQNAAVTYVYKVDRSNPAARSPVTVRYVTENGTVIHEPAIASYYPEDAISTAPLDLYGYQFVSGSITAGNEADDTDGNLVSAVAGSVGDTGSFTGIMPNQPVEITYVYEATGEGYRFTVSRLDNGTLDPGSANITPPETQQKTADTWVGAQFRELYGYAYESEEAVPASGGSFDSAHDFTGTMPSDDLIVRYRYDRIPAQWARITYLAGANGSISHGTGVSADVREQGTGSGVYQTTVLKHDGTQAGQTGSDTWGSIKEKRLAPLAHGDQYYRFAGWFIDQNGNGVMDGGEETLAEDHRFSADETLTALFEEDPEKWLDIQFAAGEHGSLADGGITSLHIPNDRTWGAIAGQIPGYVPEVNYLVDGWYDGDAQVEATDALQNGHTYTIRFYQDPAVFGTDVETPDALAGLTGEGKGKITVYHTTAGYQYIITDLSGTIVGVETGTIAGRVYADGLYPGARYLVYEAAGTVLAAVGSQIGETAGPISDPVEVLTPVVESNYQIQFDENHEGKTVLVVKPADKKSDYAVLSKDGEVILTRETGSDGWQAVTGNPGGVVFSGLNYNEEYIVVARPRGETGITAESRQPDGSVITTDPGGALEIPNYIVETIEGMVERVDQEEVQSSRYEKAHKGDRVELKAEELNGAGETFRYWKLTIGSVPGLSGRIYERELAFDMPDTNLVFTAYYTRPTASPSHAAVTEEVRGGSGNDMALDPGEIPVLEEELTTEADRILMDQNHADVTYQVVYTKNGVKATESNAVKASPEYNSDHVNAYQAAWGLHVEIERYVNGRKTAMATPSQAQFVTYVQLNKSDVDMMDYQLYRMMTDPEDGSLRAELVEMSEDPEETGGLFTFTAQAGARYVLVYSKAYRVYFINAVVTPRYQYYFKVRKGEAPGDGYYSLEYGQLEDPEDVFLSEEGVEYTYEGWSYREDRLNEFDPDREINRKTSIYAYYQDNQKEVEQARNELEDAIKAAVDKSDDYFLTLKETGKLKEAIEEALEVLERTRPKATIDELLKALEELREVTKPLDAALEDRYDHYDQIQSWKSKGGSKGSGGSGSGVKASPYNPTRSKSYTVGGNGNWEELAGDGRTWSFVLNGGIRLTGMWAKLEYANGEISKNGWYHFNANGIMDYGWFRDEKLDWYYCNTEADGWFGKMKTGWHYDKEDNRWYYLDPETGIMAKGWRSIGGKWYYFTEQNNMETYYYDPATEKWTYSNKEGRPLGSMYISEMTPDGYSVGGVGTWLQ